ncbi:ABC transporter substrate-binding protein [Variovorax sp. PBL-E5]|uniref:ABC transporter substrate-binding protein n=1 Tax=Variovorax sp. PBL-E5 TaxID=434014 RepID=UPI00131807C0|nr:ABC transporter substrate-binding protein [Variovorax sp. PBL-E5]VTU30275.1 Putative aliphatic sulfonates-binding protein precursor [Variovorax sp. PBL-E5]
MFSRFVRQLMAVTALAAASVMPQVQAQPAAAPPVGALTPVNIGLPISNYWPAYIARDLKLFEKVGLAPKFFMFQSGAPLIAGMKSGSLDVAWTGLATLFMLGQGIPLKFVLVPLDSSSQMAYVVNPASGIESYKDIAKSKNIGASTATCSEVSMVLAARAAGTQRSALHASNLAPNLMQTALQNGQIDSAFMWGPWNLLWRDAGYKIVSWDKDFMKDGGVCATTVAIRPDFLKTNPSVGCKLVKVQALAMEAARKDPEHAIRTMQEAFNIPYKTAKETYETLLIPSIESQLKPDSPWTLSNKSAGLTEKLFVAGEALREAKAITQPISRATIAEAVDDRYIREYLDKDCK